MRFPLPLCLLLSGFAFGSEDSASPPPVIRLTLGLPAIDRNGWLGAELRLGVGSTRSPLRFGVQGLELQEILSSTNPVQQVDALHAWAGYELSRTGPFSAMVFTGLGGATWVEKGNLVRPDAWWGGYEGVRRSGLSAILGVDLGVSLWRHLGLSTTCAILMNKDLGAYTDLKLDVGNW